MSADALLSRLDRVRRTGPGRWMASCPTALHEHGDRHPSLRIRETDDGRVLMICGAGCGAADVLGALGLEFDALFPPRPIEHAPRERRPFLPADVFDVARREVAVVAIIASDMRKNKYLTEADYQRVFTAADRLSDVAEAAYGR